MSVFRAARFSSKHFICKVETAVLLRLEHHTIKP